MTQTVRRARRTPRPERPGLDSRGCIEREGSPGLVPPAFRPVVAAARDGLLDLFGNRLHSACPYGSVPRGTPRVGRSDLDLLVALPEEPADADRDAVRAGRRSSTGGSGRSTAWARCRSAGRGC